jgi:ABC-type methionine transport system ATPase subunit
MQFGANLRFFIASFTGTVGDNVRYGPTLQGKTLSETAVTGLLRLADLDASFANKSIIGLSVGQAQRVALARTLANEPEVSFCAYAFVLFNCLALEYGLSIPPKKFFQTLVDADLHALQQVLLLDEPTSALDPISTHHIEDTVLQLKKTRGLTVIMVSHSIEQVKRLVDVVCVVVAGKLVEVLKIEDLDNASNPQAQEFLHEAQRK